MWSSRGFSFAGHAMCTEYVGVDSPPLSSSAKMGHKWTNVGLFLKNLAEETNPKIALFPKDTDKTIFLTMLDND